MRSINVYIHFDKNEETPETQLSKKSDFFITLAEIKRESINNKSKEVLYE